MLISSSCPATCSTRASFSRSFAKVEKALRRRPGSSIVEVSPAFMRRRSTTAGAAGGLDSRLSASTLNPSFWMVRRLNLMERARRDERSEAKPTAIRQLLGGGAEVAMCASRHVTSGVLSSMAAPKPCGGPAEQPRRTTRSPRVALLCTSIAEALAEAAHHGIDSNEYLGWPRGGCHGNARVLEKTGVSCGEPLPSSRPCPEHQLEGSGCCCPCD